MPSEVKPSDFDIEAGRAEWSSFMPALIAALNETSGRVLEIGVGHYSTPALHDYCTKANRHLVSAEEDLDWGSHFRDIYASWNHFFLLGEYDKMIPFFAQDGQWSVILLDHSLGPRRGADMAMLLPSADFVVIHDYHLAIKAAVDPYLSTLLNFHTCASKPPTLVVSAKREIPASILAL